MHYIYHNCSNKLKHSTISVGAKLECVVSIRNKYSQCVSIDCIIMVSV